MCDPQVDARQRITSIIVGIGLVAYAILFVARLLLA